MRKEQQLIQAIDKYHMAIVNIIQASKLNGIPLNGRCGLVLKVETRIVTSYGQRETVDTLGNNSHQIRTRVVEPSHQRILLKIRMLDTQQRVTLSPEQVCIRISADKVRERLAQSPE